jgi:DNA-binding transcriptional MerR regulator
MEYRVEELAAAAGVRVDTVRFYQGKGLLPAPRREGRIAIYRESHLERLRRVRELLGDGFTLAQIGRLFESERADSRGHGDALLAALVAETVGERTLSRSELAAESQVPDAVLGAARAAGLIEPIVVAGEERFTRADAEMARAGLEILGRGLPLQELLALAVDHAHNVERIADRAIELFDEHVIERAGGEDEAGDAVADAFRSLLPQVARLVALHFQRTLVNRALERLRGAGNREALERALEATGSARLEVSWRS